MASLANQGQLVTLVDVFLVHLEGPEQMVNQVMMELMVHLVHQENLENLEVLFTLIRNLTAQMSFLT